MPRTKLIFNEDGDWNCCLEPGRAVAQVSENLNWTLENVPIDIYEFHAATPDVCYYQSRVGDVLGRRLLAEVRAHVEQHPYRPPGPKPPQLHMHLALGIEHLRAEGTDPLDARAAFLHARGVKFVAEMRMSDTHHRSLDPADPLVSQFAMDHPDYVIRRSDGLTPVALDYAIEAVRSHRLAILREIAEERDVDGLSLNFMRWAKHFERDVARERAPIMTQFVGAVRRTLDDAARRRGTGRLLLGARVLSTMDECLATGLDVAAWMRRGDVDYVVVSEHNASWPALRVEQFAEAAEGTGCAVLGMMGDMIGGTWDGKPEPDEPASARAPGRSGYQSLLNTPETARAISANLHAWGAGGIGLWNIPNNLNIFGHGGWGQHPEQRERMIAWIRAATDLDAIRREPRRYHYLPLYKRHHAGVIRNYLHRENGRSPHGAWKGPTLYFHEGLRGCRQVFPFRLADGRDGQPVKGSLRLRIIHADEQDTFELDINGRALDAERLERTVHRDDPDMTWTWVTLDLAHCPPLRGDNDLGITWTSDHDHGLNVPYMEELVVQVRS